MLLLSPAVGLYGHGDTTRMGSLALEIPFDAVFRILSSRFHQWLLFRLRLAPAIPLFWHPTDKYGHLGIISADNWDWAICLPATRPL